MRTWLLGIGLLLLGSASAEAIVLVDEALDDPKAQGLHGELSLSAFGLRGNSVRSGTSGEGMLRLAHGPHAEFLLGEFARSEGRGGVVEENRSFLHLRHRTRLSHRWAWEAFAQQERDPLARIRLRKLLGAGVVFSLWRTEEEGRLDLGAGAFAEEERTTNQRQSRLWRMNIYLRLRHHLDAWHLRAVFYWQPRPDRMQDARGLGKFELGFAPASTRWHLKLAGSWRYDARPPIGAKRTDWSYRMLFGVSF